MTTVFERLQASLLLLEARVSGSSGLDPVTEARVLKERTERIARRPQHFERSPDAISCMLFERASRRYAVRIDSLVDVGLMGPIAHVPGTPDLYLGVTARRGRIVPVVDLPRIFSADVAAEEDPRWLVIAAHPDVTCGVAADALHDIIDVVPQNLGRAMPTFPSLAQRHTVGVMEDRTVVLDLGALLADRSLRVDDRGQ